MALKFALAGFSSLACYACGLRYDENFNSGIGAMLFTSITTSHFDNQDIGPIDSQTDYIVHALALVLWPGFQWGVSLYWLLEAAESRVESVWMITSPLLIVSLGVPILANANRHILGRGPLSTWRIVTGLSWIGILVGYILSTGSLGGTIDNVLSDLAPFRPLTAIMGAWIMFSSVERLAQDHMQAAKDLQSSAKSIPTDTLIPGSFPPFWGLQGPVCLMTWTVGLALCVSAVENSWIWAGLMSMSVAIVLTIGYLPPFSGKIFRTGYNGYVHMLCILYACIVLFSLLYIVCES